MTPAAHPKRTPVVIIAFLIGLAAGYLAGYMSKSNRMMMEVEPLGKVAPHPRSGDVLVWPKSAPASFVPVGGLCDEGKDNITTCTIRKGLDTGQARIFRYTCPGCTDPDVPVGSDIGVLKHPPLAQLPAAAAAMPILVYCDANTAKAYPAEAPVTKGQDIAWAPDGSLGPDTAWRVYNLINACPNDSYSDSTLCRVKDTVTLPYTYRVHVDGCTTDGSATLKAQ